MKNHSIYPLKILFPSFISVFLLSCGLFLDIKENPVRENCGDGIINLDEQCDGEHLAGYTCLTLGYKGGELACNNDCTFNKNFCISDETCGNNIIDPGEECDSTQLNYLTCSTFGFDEGILACDDYCSYDTSGCSNSIPCGNGVMDTDETCDGTNLNEQSCFLLGYESGILSCNDTCDDFNVDLCNVGMGYVGSSCKVPDDCDALNAVPSLTAECISVLDVKVFDQPQTVEIPGGYCTAKCDLSNDKCGASGDCVDGSFFDLEPYCLDPCYYNIDCRQGYKCQDLGTGDGKKYCFPPLGK